MGKKMIPQRELPALLAKLEERGATKVRRSPARSDGLVRVQWEDPSLERQQRQAILKGFKQILAISVLVAVLMVAILALISL